MGKPWRGKKRPPRDRRRPEVSASDPRLPPQDLDAERAVLGAVLLDATALILAQPLLTVDDFYRVAHREIYRAMGTLSARGEAIDTVTLAAAITAGGKLESVGGAAYLAELIQQTATSANVAAHARIVKDRAILRELVALGTELAVRGYDQEPAAGLVGLAEERIFALAGGTGRTSVTQLAPVLKQTVDYMQQLAERNIAVTGVPTGFPSVDRLTAGWQPGDLIILAARPSMGKTAFALGTATAAAKAGKRVFFASLEMGRQSLGFRFLAMESGVDLHHLRTGRIRKDDWTSIAVAANALESLPLTLDDSADLSVTDLRTLARQQALKHGLDLLVVDYLQLLRPEPGENRQTEIAAISRGLKLLAKELHVPLLVLSQLNRSCEQREDKRPILADLRDSGSIEQDADVVLCLYRDEVYDDQSPDKGLAELLVRKQRNGPIGEPKLKWIKETATFEDLPGPAEG